MSSFKQTTWWIVGVVVVILAGCGQAGEVNNLEAKRLAEVGQLKQAITPGVPIWYNGNTAAQYAYDYAYVGDGPKPFYLWPGNNCVNFASQSILAGLSGKSNPTDLNSIAGDYDDDATSGKAAEYQWFYNGASSGKPWRSTTALWKYANHSWSEPYGLRFNYITNSTAADPENLNADKVLPGDIVFGDWYGDDGLFNHTMIVVWVDSDATKKALDRIHVASQTENTSDWTLRDGFYAWAKRTYGGVPVFHIHRPLYFIAKSP